MRVLQTAYASVSHDGHLPKARDHLSATMSLEEVTPFHHWQHTQQAPTPLQLDLLHARRAVGIPSQAPSPSKAQPTPPPTPPTPAPPTSPTKPSTPHLQQRHELPDCSPVRLTDAVQLSRHSSRAAVHVDRRCARILQSQDNVECLCLRREQA